MVNLWKYSRLRFYLMNLVWNYKFWLHAKPVYKDFHYTVEKDMDLDQTLSDPVMRIQVKTEKKVQKRFIGFHYKGQIFMDNPGIQGVDSKTWDAWIKKGLIHV